MWIKTKALFLTGSVVNEDEQEWEDFVFCTDALESFNRSDREGGTALRFMSGEAFTVDIDFETFFEMLQSEIVIYGQN